ncbi:MAG TPA: helix-turn-helix domain-containing protein [Candidatus Acidoferrales bacterium]|nr:helix-turn-helix domain-containing protein [Candidatus Acidoferrales bacterium]
MPTNQSSPKSKPPASAYSYSEHRSGCPVNISLELVGDRWSLLIVRDVMVRAYHSFKQFQQSGEGIATNILTDRLRKLQAGGILVAEPDPADGRRVGYYLTEKGIDLAPVILDLLVWATNHEHTGAASELVTKMAENRSAVIAEVRRRWRARDPVGFLPSFVAAAAGTLQFESRDAKPRTIRWPWGLNVQADRSQQGFPLWLVRNPYEGGAATPQYGHA